MPCKLSLGSDLLNMVAQVMEFDPLEAACSPVSSGNRQSMPALSEMRQKTMRLLPSHLNKSIRDDLLLNDAMRTEHVSSWRGTLLVLTTAEMRSERGTLTSAAPFPGVSLISGFARRLADHVVLPCAFPGATPPVILTGTHPNHMSQRSSCIVHIDTHVSCHGCDHAFVRASLRS